jgi:hypothetical protein
MMILKKPLPGGPEGRDIVDSPASISKSVFGKRRITGPSAWAQ